MNNNNNSPFYLSPYELALLEAAIKEENTTGACMHSWPKQEAAYLYELAQKGDKTAQSALKDVLSWWIVYFSCGYEKAAKIRDDVNAALIDSLKLLEKIYEERSNAESTVLS